MGQLPTYFCFLLSLFALSLVGKSQFTFAATAENCKIEKSELPKCDGDGLLVGRHKPAVVAFPPPVSPEKFMQLLSNTQGTPTKIGMLEGHYNKLLERYKGDPEKIKLIESRGIGFPMASNFPPDSTTGYARDELIFGFDSKTNTIIRTSLNPKLNLSNDSSFCGLGMRTENSTFKSDRDRGGNVMALPGGVCASVQGIQESLIQQYCGRNKPPLLIDGKFSRIGHIDEIFNVIPNSKLSPPCDFTILTASPKKMKEILKSNPSEPFFKDEKTIKEISYGPAAQCPTGGCYKVLDFCSDLESVALLTELEDQMGLSQPGSPQRKTKDGAITFQISFFPYSHAAGEKIGKGKVKPALKKEAERNDNSVNSDRQKHATFYEISEKWKGTSCAAYTNAHALSATEAQTKFTKVRLWIEANKSDLQDPSSLASVLKNRISSLDLISKDAEEMESVQNENFKKISRQLPPECKDPRNFKMLPSLWVRGHSLNPNPTNLQTVGNSVLFPEQFNSALNNSVQNELKENLIPVSVNTFQKHSGGGNVHCTSNEIRVCAP